MESAISKFVMKLVLHLERVAIPSRWKEFLFQRGCSFDVNSILRAGLIAGGRGSKEERQTVFFTPSNPFGNGSNEEET